MWILNVLDILKKNNVEYAIAGGWAVSLHGAVRGTVDLDIVLTINNQNYERAELALIALGLKSRLPLQAKEVVQFRREYIEKRNLIAWSFIDYKNPAHVVDIVITHDLKNMKTQNKNIMGRKITLVAVESLIEMKAAAGRPQDIEDIIALRGLSEKSTSNT